MNKTEFKNICKDIDEELLLWYNGPELHINQLKISRRIAYSALLYGEIITDENKESEKLNCCYSIKRNDLNFIGYETKKGNIYILGTPYNAYCGYLDKDFEFHGFSSNPVDVFGFRLDIEGIKTTILKLRKEKSFAYNIKKLLPYFLPKKKNLLISAENLGHHIWNEQAGLDYFIEHKLIKYFNKALFYVDYFDTAKMLVKYKIPSEFVRYRNFITWDILVSPAVHTYKKITSERLLDFCLKESKINVDSYNNKFVIILCLRHNKRRWIEEIESIPKIINDITGKYKNVEFLLDGFSSPSVECPYAQDNNSITKDLENYKKITESLSDEAKIRTHCIIGFRCLDKVMIYYNAQLLVMPYGTPEHYNWIVQKPIITYGPASAKNLSKFLHSKPILKDVDIDNTEIPDEYIQAEPNNNYHMNLQVLENYIMEKLML